MTKERQYLDTPELIARAERIASLNDMFRANPFAALPNRMVLTQGISAIFETANHEDRRSLMSLVRTFDQFDEGNDPYGQRDFGCFDWLGTRCFWKIDYFDTDLAYGSEKPENPDQTIRVLTILRADEY